MGLVVHAPGDALLALLAGPSGEGAASAAPGEGGMFAELMATLLPDGSSEGSEGDAMGEGLGLPHPAAPEQESKTSNESALALLTAAALVQFVPQSKPAGPATEVHPSPAAEPIATVGEPAPPVELIPAEHQPPAAESATGEPEAQALPATNPGPVESGAATTAAEAPAIEAVEAAASSSLPEPQTEAETRPRSTSETPPGEQPSEAQNASGVVRPVGNAETSNRSQSGQDNAKFGERGEPSTPPRIENTPRASAKGIENAAPNSPVGELRGPTQATPLAEAAPAQAPAPIELPPQVDQVAATIFESVEVGATEATLRLDPAEMGEVVIRIHSDGDGLRIDIRAERPEALQLLRDRTEELSQLLGDRGLNLSDVNVGLGRRDNDQSGDGTKRRGDTPANGEFANILGIDEPGSAARHNRLRSAYNPDGLHIYRV